MFVLVQGFGLVVLGLFCCVDGFGVLFGGLVFCFDWLFGFVLSLVGWCLCLFVVMVDSVCSGGLLFVLMI